MSGFVPAEGDAVVVPVAIVPVRAEPTHRAERISEWILGETLRVERVEDGWMRAAGPDGYAGWTHAGPFRVSADTTARWEREATLRSLGTGVRSGPLARLPWGARLAPGPGKTCRLPGGRSIEPAEPERIVPAGDRVEVGARAARALVDDARSWLGVPYAWGGRTELGVDCSGFVQALFALRGARLPRDSRDQSEAGTELEAPSGGGPLGALPGDLLFFAPEGRGVTHVALSEGGSGILHASSTRGCVAADDLAADDDLCGLLQDSLVAWTRPLE